LLLVDLNNSLALGKKTIVALAEVQYSTTSFFCGSSVCGEAQSTEGTVVCGMAWHGIAEGQKKDQKTYNSRYSLVVTHPTTNLPI
jgi:hypothetical protein